MVQELKLRQDRVYKERLEPLINEGASHEDLYDAYSAAYEEVDNLLTRAIELLEQKS